MVNLGERAGHHLLDTELIIKPLPKLGPLGSLNPAGREQSPMAHTLHWKVSLLHRIADDTKLLMPAKVEQIPLVHFVTFSSKVAGVKDPIHFCIFCMLLYYSILYLVDILFAFFIL